MAFRGVCCCRSTRAGGCGDFRSKDRISRGHRNHERVQNWVINEQPIPKISNPWDKEDDSTWEKNEKNSSQYCVMNTLNTLDLLVLATKRCMGKKHLEHSEN